MQYHVSSGHNNWEVEADSSKAAALKALDTPERLELQEIVVVNDGEHNVYFSTRKLLADLQTEFDPTLNIRLVQDDNEEADDEQGDGK